MSGTSRKPAARATKRTKPASRSKTRRKRAKPLGPPDWRPPRRTPNPKAFEIMQELEEAVAWLRAGLPESVKRRVRWR